MAIEGERPKANGDILYASEVNSNSVIQVYTGTGFNSSQSGVGNDEQSHELTAVTTGLSSTIDYVRIRITGTGLLNANATAAADTQIKIQVKETAGAYGDSLAYTIFNKVVATATVNEDQDNSGTIEYYHTLTAGEKANGFQVKVFSKSTCVSTATASFTNINTTQEMIQEW